MTFQYSACEHRYSPKMSTDWRSWYELDEAGNPDGPPAYSVKVSSEPVYVSAQEILPVATYEDWGDGLVNQAKTRRSVIGQSVEGRALHALSIGNGDAERVVLILGRQHPPEISGSLALFAFVQTLVADTPEATSFRDDTLILVVPIVNPDGVEDGHWRHNAGGVDLNRDWGIFTQPETRAVQAYLDEVLSNGGALSLVLDFHSTGRDVLYTLPEGTMTEPERFTPLWIETLERRLSGFTFELAPGYSAGNGVAKNYFYQRYGVPAITVELGDDTDRGDVARAGQAAALAMFEVLEGFED